MHYYVSLIVLAYQCRSLGSPLVRNLYLTSSRNGSFREWQRARSNTFCACLEGAYTIDKTTDALPDRVYQFYP